MSYNKHVLICGGTGCLSSKSAAIGKNIEEALKEKGINDVQVIKTGCFGFCEKGPIVKIMPDNTFYVEVKPEDAGRIVEEHIIKGEQIENLLYKDPVTKERIHEGEKMGFYKKQMRIALRNCGLIDPENILTENKM